MFRGQSSFGCSVAKESGSSRLAFKSQERMVPSGIGNCDSTLTKFMLQIFHQINVDWLGKRRFFIGISIALMLAGMGTAFYRHKFHPNGTEAINLGVDFKGGTVITLRFKQPPPADSLRAE